VKRLALLVALCAAMLAGTAHAAPAAITNATVMTGAGTTLENATVVVDGGRIRSVGPGPAPAGATVIDGTGRVVTPGLVVGMSDLGIDEIGGVAQANDTEARKSPFSAALDIVPAINGREGGIAVARAGGVTRAVVAPAASRDIFAGQGAIITLRDGSDVLVRGRALPAAGVVLTAPTSRGRSPGEEDQGDDQDDGQENDPDELTNRLEHIADVDWHGCTRSSRSTPATTWFHVGPPTRSPPR